MTWLPRTSGGSHLSAGIFSGVRRDIGIKKQWNSRSFPHDCGSVPGSQKISIKLNSYRLLLTLFQVTQTFELLPRLRSTRCCLSAFPRDGQIARSGRPSNHKVRLPCARRLPTAPPGPPCGRKIATRRLELGE